MQEPEKEEEIKKKEVKKEEEIPVAVIEYNNELRYLEAQMIKINEGKKQIVEMQEMIKKRAERYRQRVERLMLFPDDPEKWYAAELKEVEEHLEKALRENILSVYDEGLMTVDYIPRKVVRRVDPNDEENERTYELKWATMHQYIIKILAELNESHPKFTYEIDLVHLPEKACIFCQGTEEEHCCKGSAGLLRLKKSSVKVSADSLPLPSTSEETVEEEKSENKENQDTKDQEATSTTVDEDQEQFVCVEQEGNKENNNTE